MKLSNVPSASTLLEMIEVAPETVGGRQIAPMQFFKNTVRNSAVENRYFLLSGFQGPSKNDVHMANLALKAVSKGVFNPIADLFATPVLNPSSDPKSAWNNHKGQDMRDALGEGKDILPEIEILQRWIQFAKPNAILVLTLGTPGIYTNNVPTSVGQRLAELSEKPLFEASEQSPATSTMPGLRDWCLAQGLRWIEIVFEETKKSFDETRDEEWKRSVGPAVKWLLEGERFNPPKEEPVSLEHLIVPALEMPPEFAHL